MTAKPSCTSTQWHCKDPLGFGACIYHYTSAPKSHCVPSSKQKHQFSKKIVAKLQKFACRCVWLFLTRITFKLRVPVLVWHRGLVRGIEVKMGDERVAEQPKAAGVCKDFYFAQFRTPVFTGLSSNACKPQQPMVGCFFVCLWGEGVVKTRLRQSSQSQAC